MSGPDGKAHYYLLEERKDEIEALLGYPVIWYENPSRVESALIVETQGELAKQSDWPRQFEWLARHLQDFNDKLGPIIRTLDAGEYLPAEEAEEDL